MEAAVLWTGVLGGALGVVYAVAVRIAHQREAELAGGPAVRKLQDYDQVLGILAAVSILVGGGLAFLGILKKGIFTPGEGLAEGLGIGVSTGVLAAILSYLCERAALQRRELNMGSSAEPIAVSLSRLALASTAGLLGIGVLGVSVAALSSPEALVHSLAGFAMGTVLVASVFAATGGALREVSRLAIGWPLEVFALYTGLLAASVVLATLHSGGNAGVFVHVPGCIGGLACAGVLIVSPMASIPSSARRSALVKLVLGVQAAVILILGALAITKLPLLRGVLGCVFVGLVLAGAGQLLCEVLCRPSADEFPASRLQALTVTALLVLLGAAVSMRLLAGYGVGLSMVAATCASVFFLVSRNEADDEGREPDDTATVPRPLALCLAMGMFFLLYRLCIERYPDVQLVELGVHYNFVAIVGAALLPALMTAYNARTAEAARDDLTQRGRRALPGTNSLALVIARVLLLGAVLAVLPLALLSLWGLKAIVGLIVGTLVGMAYLGLLPALGATRARAAWGIMPMLIGMGMCAVQLPQRYMELARLMRETRIQVAIGIAAVVAAWILIDTSLLSLRRAFSREFAPLPMDEDEEDKPPESQARQADDEDEDAGQEDAP